MSDDLYTSDVPAWSESQADLIRRHARGERVNDIDWDHVAEEIEDVGLSELNPVRSNLLMVLVHLLKLHGWPDSQAANHWRSEVVAHQKNAAQRFAPSMRRKIDVVALYVDAAEVLERRH